MQGKKQYSERLFVHFQLSNHIPEDNFYRRLSQVVDFKFLYQKTKNYYGTEGQKSIDPVVFMKLMLVGYLENLNSDRRIINIAKMRMDILYFIGYDIDEALPWHSTLSRTRQLYEQDVFSEIFKSVLKQCVDKGMVSGRRQAVDGVFVKANASLDSMVEREILEDADVYTAELESNTDEAVEAAAKAVPKQKVPFSAEAGGGKPTEDGDKASPLEAVTDEYARKHKREKAVAATAKTNIPAEAGAEQKVPFSAEAGGGKPAEDGDKASPLEAVTDEYTKEHDKLARHTKPDNQTHYNPFDPDAKMSVKPGKATALNYLGQVSVDTDWHTITHIQVFTADKRDSQCLPDVLDNLVANLKENELVIDEILADTGYSSGEALKALERKNIIGYIPNRPQFIYERPGFIYNSAEDSYTCPNNEKLTYRGTYKKDTDSFDKLYRAKRTTCNACPLKNKCLAYGKIETIIKETVDRPYYVTMHGRMNNSKAKRLMKKRQSTVEPVIGTLTNFLGMKKVNTKGLAQANKCVTIAGAAYNLKKLLNYRSKTIITNQHSVKKQPESPLISAFKAFYRLQNQYRHKIGQLQNFLWLRPIRIYIFII